MKELLVRSLLLAAMLSIVSFGLALAHGEAVITVEPSVVAPGGQITVTGADMEAGEEFTITLENALTVIPLGDATAIGEGDEAGFTVTLTIPPEVQPGSYVVRAATEEGESITADLSVVALEEQAGGESEAMEPSAEPLTLERPRSTGLLAVVIVAAIISAGVGLWLVRRRG